MPVTASEGLLRQAQKRFEGLQVLNVPEAVVSERSELLQQMFRSAGATGPRTAVNGAHVHAKRAPIATEPV